MKTRAAVTPAEGVPFTFEELELDEPRADEVQVQLVAAGVCHTDAVVRDGWIPTTFPVVLGHEGAGVVQKLGAGVTHLAVGDHVVLSFGSCGNCTSCLGGHPAYCVHSYDENFAGSRGDGSDAFAREDGTAVTSHFFGQSSFSEVSNVSARSVVKVADDVPLQLLGPLGCGIQTGAGAVLNILRPPTGASIVIFGTGAVGMSAVLAAVVSHAETIIAVDVLDSRLEFARELGATHVINGRNEDVVARIREITGGGVQFALDTTGNSVVFRQMIDSLGYHGHAAILGAAKPGSEGTIDLSTSLALAISITTVIEGDSVPQTFIPELISLYKKGLFPFDRLIKTFPFDDINQAFEASETGVVLKPVVIF
jgi:aryl-alcohol dehydrogenase